MWSIDRSPWSYSSLWITRYYERIKIDIPIKTAGMIELLEKQAKRKLPVPPVTYSDDYSIETVHGCDEKYKDLFRKQFTYDLHERILSGISVDIFNANGNKVMSGDNLYEPNTILNFDEALNILLGSGIAPNSLEQLDFDISMLTSQHRHVLDTSIRKTLGFPDSLYEEIFGDDPKAITSGPPNPLKVDTEFTVEMGLVAEYANGSMKDWNRRSWADRRMWMYYKLLQNAKIKYAEDNAAQNSPKILDQHGKPMPTVVQYEDRPGIRNR